MEILVVWEILAKISGGSKWPLGCLRWSKELGISRVKLFQSACTKFNSTETTLLAVHDHIISKPPSTTTLYQSHDSTASHWSIQQQVTGRCLLDLSAPFDTIDHFILLHRLKSWFGFTETVLSWIKSYLSSFSWTVDINGIKSPPSQLLYGVPQSPVIGPLLFILYTTPLSSIISQSSVNYKLYADNTFSIFSSDAVSENILLLQNTIFYYPTYLYGWPQTFYLSLLKLTFLSLVFPHNLQKFTIPHLQFLLIQTIQLVSSARNLGVIFDSDLSFSDHISYMSKSCFSHICDLRCIRSTLAHKTTCTTATSIIHSKLDYSTSAVNNSIGFNSFLTLLLVQSQKLQNSITLLLISNHFTGSKLHNVYNTKFFH